MGARVRSLPGRDRGAALATLALVFAPQAHFLVSADFLPLAYAAARAGAAGGPGSFLVAQLADHAVFLLMALVAGLFGAGAVRPRPEEAAARRFLLVMALVPVLLAVVMAGASGMGLKDMWGMPMFNLSGLLLLALFPGRFDGRRLARIVAMAAVLLALVPAAYAASVVLRAAWSDKPSRAVWPQEQIVSRVLRAYARETGAMPRIVAGPVWEAGLVALAAPGAPSVSIDGDERKSPWLPARKIAEKGALAVWPTRSGPAPPLAALVAGQPLRHEIFRWSDSSTARPIRITWTVVPPVPGGAPSGAAQSHR